MVIVKGFKPKWLHVLLFINIIIKSQLTFALEENNTENLPPLIDETDLPVRLD